MWRCRFELGDVTIGRWDQVIGSSRFVEEEVSHGRSRVLVIAMCRGGGATFTAEQRPREESNAVHPICAYNPTCDYRFFVSNAMHPLKSERDKGHTEVNR